MWKRLCCCDFAESYKASTYSNHQIRIEYTVESRYQIYRIYRVFADLLRNSLFDDCWSVQRLGPFGDPLLLDFAAFEHVLQLGLNYVAIG